MTRSRLFRYSRWDALLVGTIPLQAGFYALLAGLYAQLSLASLLALAPVCFLLSLQNAGANHNHYHTPVFRARWLNVVTSMGFSMTGAPKTPYNIGHGLHHVTAQSWNQESILAIWGLRRPLHVQILGFVQFVLESLGLKYLFLLYVLERWPLERVARLASKKEPEQAAKLLSQLRQPALLSAAKLDLAAWLVFRLALLAIDWRFFCFYFLPVSYVVDTLRLAENYLQHWGAHDPEDPARDSVSCYATVYNWLTFNLGYHQEHHLRPGVHWLKLARTTAELGENRRVVPLSHWVNLPVFYPDVAQRWARDPDYAAKNQQV